MLQQLESVKSKWGGKSQVIDRWLMDRQALLVSFCELAGINKRSECLPDPDDRQLLQRITRLFVGRTL